jgi:hypothetical protein
VLLATSLACITAPLEAQGCPEPEARLFDFWLGEWNVNNRYVVQGRWRDIGQAEVEVFPAAGGCTIVELWDGMMGARRVRGFSARTWDPADSAWKLVLNWPQPGQPTFGTLSGRFRHGRGDFFTTPSAANPRSLTRYTFADISPDSFRWNDGTSGDSGLTWETQWIMEYSRRPARARPVRNAAVASGLADPLCSGPEFDDPAGLLGRWRDSSGTTAHAWRIIGGCAVLLFVEWKERGSTQELFAVIGRDARAGEWVAWISSTVHRGFQKLTGREAASFAGKGVFAWNTEGTTASLEWNAPGGANHRFRLTRP